MVRNRAAAAESVKKRGRLFHLAIGLAVAFCFLGLLELGARLVFLLVPNEVLHRVAGRAHLDFINLSFVHEFEPDDYLFWRLRPDNKAFGTNSQGFRGPEFEPEAEKNKIRVLCVGDSCTFGLNVPEAQTYPSQLQSMLDSAFGTGRFRVVNAGVMGYSSFQGRRFLQRMLPFYRPHFVVIYYGNNDLWPAYYYDSEQIPPSLFRLKKALEKSRLFCLTQILIDRARIWLSGATTERTVSIDLSGKRHVFYVERRKKIRVPPAQFESNYRAMIDLCERYHALPILIVTPRGSRSQRHRLYRQIIRDVATDRKVPLVDAHRLLSRLRSEAVFLDEKTDVMHPNARGYGIIARELFKVIESHLPLTKRGAGG